ncbi:CAP domain-containing protein [Streptomyces sp. NPDC029674]|uniref:CAP domain-containing protein n=1 Tax=Streptomyces sp. NPDC029674 TaxID=3365297 RepID=UPI00384EEBB7
MTGTSRRTLARPFVLLAALLALPQPAWAVPPASPSADMVDAVNRHRADAGCPPVRLRDALNRAAQRHSADMSRHDHLSHAGTDGSRPAGRMRDAGYRPGPAGEVIAAGPGTPRGAVSMWMDSPSHRTIVLTCDYTDAGVGVADGPGGPWWTLDLAAGR